MAADLVGNYFMGDPEAQTSDQDGQSGARDKRAVEAWEAVILPLRGGGEKEPLTCEDGEGGGSKNRTCDLSIISAAL